MNKLLTHYGKKFGVRLYMQMSMELLVTELGISSQPLAMPYPQYHEHLTHCWLKLVWEKSLLLDTCIEIALLPPSFLREQDWWIMESFETLDFNSDELACLS
jgi:hypothetical protein